MKKEEEYKKKITMIEILAIIVTIIIILLIGSKKTNSIAYEVNYNGINCPTPYVVFYSNGSYEYYQYYGTEIELKPSKGKYDYKKLLKAIENVQKYESNYHGPYTIKTSNGKFYTTYNSNKELVALLNELNINLERCMTYQE